MLSHICRLSTARAEHRALHCRKFVVKQLAQQLRPQLEAIVKLNDAAANEVYSPDAKSAARRAVKNKALAYLAALGEESVTQQVLNRFRTATNMTDKIAALSALIDSEGRHVSFHARLASSITMELVGRCVMGLPLTPAQVHTLIPGHVHACNVAHLQHV